MIILFVVLQTHIYYITGVSYILRSSLPLQSRGFIFIATQGIRPGLFRIFGKDQTGFVLLYKRLDNGRFQWPRNPAEVRTLTRQQYRWLLEGLSIEQPKAFHGGQGKKDF